MLLLLLLSCLSLSLAGWKSSIPPLHTALLSRVESILLLPQGGFFLLFWCYYCYCYCYAQAQLIKHCKLKEMTENKRPHSAVDEDGMPPILRQFLNATKH